MPDPIKEGDMMPSFSLKDQNGNTVNIGDFVGSHSLVVFFYPKDFTPGCTTEVCSFRDSFQDFEDIGAKVFGISGDSEGMHDKFAKKHRLQFPLLSDKGNKVRKDVFGVPRGLLGLLPGRVTYVADSSGKVIKVFNHTSGSNHHEEALAALKG